MTTKIKTKYLLVFIIWMWALVAFGQDTTNTFSGRPTFHTEVFSITPDDTIRVFDTPGLTLWKTSDSVRILHQFIFDYTGTELAHHKMTVIDVSFEHNATTYTIKNIDGNYVVSFWGDGSQVVYTYRNKYCIITGNIAY